jgi:protease-4
VGELCTSAAYYFALGFEHVIARPASLLGGLRSSLEVVNYSKAHAHWGLTRNFYSNGPLKRMLSPHAADLAAGEEQAIGVILADLDDQFHGFLRQRRPAAKLAETFFDGRLVSGLRAHQAGLVDALGGVSEAAQAIARILQQASVEIETIQADETPSATPPAGLPSELALLLASLR